MERSLTLSSASCNKAFHRELITLVVPIALQNLISASINLTDVLVLGTLNQTVMSAVSLAGQITFVLTLFYMGLSTGAGILAAQYWGKSDVKAIERILSIACTLSAAVSFVFFVLSLCLPEGLMRVFTSDTALIGYGARFLSTISFSYLAMACSQMYLSVLKSMENARLSAFISSACLVLNIALTALCVFVLFPGMPEEAITGVATATVFVRFLELSWCVVHW